MGNLHLISSRFTLEGWSGRGKRSGWGGGLFSESFGKFIMRELAAAGVRVASG